MVERRQSQQSSAGLAGWRVAAPFPYIDRYLLVIRWVALVGVSVVILGTDTVSSGPAEAYDQPLLSPLAALPVVIGLNLLISFLVWVKQPLVSGQAGWLLLGDIGQATLFTALTGGLSSPFFVLFPIAAIGIGLVFYWQAALLLTTALTLLHAGVVLLMLEFEWNILAAAVLTAKSFVILTLGALVALFNRQLQREKAARRQTTLAAARATALNQIFLRLAEESLEPDQILETVLDGIRVLPAVDFGLVLQPEATPEQWQIAASSTSRYPVGKSITGLTWPENNNNLFTVGAGTGQPLPNFVVGDEVTRLICSRLTTPGGDTLGVIVIGQLTAQPLGDDDQTFLRILAKEAGLALRTAYLYVREQDQVARLRRFEELQSVFFSAIGHELKTPLTVLKTLTPALARLPELPPETQAEITDAVEQNLARLELLITELLESSRLEAKAVALHQRSINLANRLQRVLDSLAPVLERKRQQVEVKSEPDLPPVWADGRRLEQILSNLLHNAAKFAPADSTIQVELATAGEFVQVGVVDAGPGVPPHERARIFDKFYIAAEDKALAGVGLGLFICRELVQLHGGQIWLEERPGGGSRFCFTLPIAGEAVTNEKSQP